MDPFKIKARSLMKSYVVRLNAGDPVKKAIEMFEEYSISGAPVVNEAGELVGVLSDSDILKTEHLDNDRKDKGRSDYYLMDPFEKEDDLSFSREDYDPRALGKDLIADWMTPRIVSVEPDATLGEICAILTRERIHRVFVLEAKQLIGVVSTFDIVEKLSKLAKRV